MASRGARAAGCSTGQESGEAHGSIGCGVIDAEPTAATAREALILAQLQSIAASIGEVRERLAVLEGLRQDTARHELSLQGLDDRVRTLEVSAGQVGERLATLTGGGGLVVGAVVAWLVGRVLGGP